MCSRPTTFAWWRPRSFRPIAPAGVWWCWSADTYIKVGLGPLLSDWVRQGIITHVAMNGAAAIHDYELAAFGGTSEDVESGLRDGTFGMAEETGSAMNAAINAAHARGQGLGEGLADSLSAIPDLPGRDASVLLACRDRNVPVTVHASIGAEIIHQHPTANGAALGETSHRDFRRLAGSLPDLDSGGVVLNLGSAVVLPEVFLKALTIARNLGDGKPDRVPRRRLRHDPALSAENERRRAADAGWGNRTHDHRASRGDAAAPGLDGRRSESRV